MTTTTTAPPHPTTHSILLYARLVFFGLALLLIAEAVRAAEPNMTPIVSGPTTATVGTSYKYTLLVSNIGAAPSKGTVTVTDALHPSLAINSISTSSQAFACTMSAQTVSCTSKSPIPAGAVNVGVASIDVTPTSAGAVDNHATVSGGGDANPADNKTVPITTTVEGPVGAVGAVDLAPELPIPTLGTPLLMLLASLVAAAGVMATKGRAYGA